jgi:uncharacterized protein (DUF1800 family)
LAQQQTIAAIRFGAGLSPAVRGVDGPDAILADLAGEDTAARRFPIIGDREAAGLWAGFAKAKLAQRENRDDPALGKVKEGINAATEGALIATAARWMDAPVGFRERLQQFWSDHFTVRARGQAERALAPAYVEWAIRPHMGGRFADLLIAAETHPMMLVYLDQVSSIGPNSPGAQRRRRKVQGLNENLAREVLELHTLGVGGAYTQTDVRQFAELLTGLTATAEKGMVFRPNLAEPGSETVLGVSYGGDRAGMNDILTALRDIAVHPDTAAHIARKLAVHFTSDTPDPAMVADMTAAFADTGGHLPSVYRAMLNHPAAWNSFGAKARQPFDFVLAALRALGVSGADLAARPLRDMRRGISGPLQTMGQPWLQAPGPNGWPEEAGAWITPQGMAARIEWAMRIPRAANPDLPDPRAFVTTALADAAGDNLVWAADKAETRVEGVGVILASPEFNRR